MHRHCFSTIPDGALGTEALLTPVKLEEADVTQRTFPQPASSLPPQPPDPLSPPSPVWVRRSAVQDSLLWVPPVERAGPCRGHQAFQEEALKTPRVAAVWGQKPSWGFPDGSVVNNPPAHAGDTGSILCPEDPTCRGATKPVRHDS